MVHHAGVSRAIFAPGPGSPRFYVALPTLAAASSASASAPVPLRRPGARSRLTAPGAAGRRRGSVLPQMSPMAQGAHGDHPRHAMPRRKPASCGPGASSSVSRALMQRSASQSQAGARASQVLNAGGWPQVIRRGEATSAPARYGARLQPALVPRPARIGPARRRRRDARPRRGHRATRRQRRGRLPQGDGEGHLVPDRQGSVRREQPGPSPLAPSSTTSRPRTAGSFAVVGRLSCPGGCGPGYSRDSSATQTRPTISRAHQRRRRERGQGPGSPHRTCLPGAGHSTARRRGAGRRASPRPVPPGSPSRSALQDRPSEPEFPRRQVTQRPRGAATAGISASVNSTDTSGPLRVAEGRRGRLHLSASGQMQESQKRPKGSFPTRAPAVSSCDVFVPHPPGLGRPPPPVPGCG